MAPADQFSALADATRCRVVELLSARPMPVHELTAAFSISRPAISRHLRVLKSAGLVKELKRGRENVYSLQRERLSPVQKWLEQQSTAPAPRPATRRKPGRAPALVEAVADTRVSEPEPAVPVVVASRQKPKPPAPARLPDSQLTLF